ncbi:MAG: isochorismate synthase MenF [Cyanobacteriota bacterium]
MQEPDAFPTLLAAAARGAAQLEEEGVLSLALRLPWEPCQPGPDPLQLLPHLKGADPFRFLWDGAPGLCLAASGRSHSLDLSGPRRFELAQRFSSLSLSRLAMPQACPALARPRVLLAFAFFDSPLHEGMGVPGLQAVLPRWQLSRQGRQGWLRLQRPLGGDVTARSLAEELWEEGTRIRRLCQEGWADNRAREPESALLDAADLSAQPWRRDYLVAVERALELVDEEELQKLVLAVRQPLLLQQPLDPLALLDRLRRRQAGSCRFLWQRTTDDVLFGASPERLLTVRQGQLRSDALAGTALAAGEARGLLQSGKDRHEHELVVETISRVLGEAGLIARRPRHPRLARHGHLVHLHTPITADLGPVHPLALAERLHPTPAVAGLPRRQAMGWLRSLEPFERGHYAAPIGWIDSEGDTDLRVAIRSGHLRGRQLDLTAGAGLVRGSNPERELEEVGLKLDVLRQQLGAPGSALAARHRG